MVILEPSYVEPEPLASNTLVAELLECEQAGAQSSTPETAPIKYVQSMVRWPHFCSFNTNLSMHRAFSKSMVKEQYCFLSLWTNMQAQLNLYIHYFSPTVLTCPM